MHGVVSAPQVSKKKALESQKAPSLIQSRRAKSTAPETPASQAPSWHCSHCNKYHTLPSAVSRKSPHKPFTEEHGFSKREVEKDGDCFYSCIIECLDSDETYKEVMGDEFSRMGEKTPFKNKLTVKFMRELVASKVRREGERPIRGVWKSIPSLDVSFYFLPFHPPPPLTPSLPPSSSSRPKQKAHADTAGSLQGAGESEPG